MFGKENKKGVPLGTSAPEEKSKAPIHMSSIPDIFYGGADPQIYHAQTAKVPFSKKPERPASTTGVPSQPATAQAVVAPKNRKLFYILGSIFFLISVGLISWYYIRQMTPVSPVVIQEPTAPRVQEPVIPTEPTPTTSTPEIITPTTTEDEIVTTTPNEGPILEFPRIVLVDSVDLDADSLTDVEEELFGTDSGTWDSDEDGYYDGQEVVNLYNPKQVAPVKLIDSGLVREYVNPKWQYRLYYPLGWEAASVDDNSDQVLFSAITGDYIEILAMEKGSDETFQDWFSKNAKGQSYTDTLAFINRFEVEGFKRQDNLVAYFVKGNTVYVIIYQPGTTGFIPFRHVMIMMMQSFRPTKTSVVLPEQTILPVVTSSEATSTEVATTTP